MVDGKDRPLVDGGCRCRWSHAAIDLPGVRVHRLQGQRRRQPRPRRPLFPRPVGPTIHEERRRFTTSSQLPLDLSQRQAASQDGRPWDRSRACPWPRDRSAGAHLIAWRGACALMAPARPRRPAPGGSNGRRLVARGSRSTRSRQPSDQPPRLLPLEQRGTARSSTVDPPNPSEREQAQPGAHLMGDHSFRSSAWPGPSSTAGRREAPGTDRGLPRSARWRRSNSTRSWATCWSMKKTSSSLAATHEGVLQLADECRTRAGEGRALLPNKRGWRSSVVTASGAGALDSVASEGARRVVLASPPPRVRPWLWHDPGDRTAA